MKVSDLRLFLSSPRVAVLKFQCFECMEIAKHFQLLRIATLETGISKDGCYKLQLKKDTEEELPFVVEKQVLDFVEEVWYSFAVNLTPEYNKAIGKKASFYQPLALLRQTS